MSVCVAVSKGGRTVVAADTQTNFGGEVLPLANLRTSKIRRVGDALLGRAGWGVYDNILSDLLDDAKPPVLDGATSIFRFFNTLWRTLHRRYAFVNDQSKGKNSPFGDLGGSFLVGSVQGIYYVAPNLGVTRFNQYYAIGSGADYSLGALHQLYDRTEDPAAIARSAVETAIALNMSCGGEIDLLEST